MKLIPSFLIENRFRQALAGIQSGMLRYTLPNGETGVYKGHKPGPEGQVTIRDWDALRLMFTRGDIGLGEGYVDGLWDTEDVEALVTLFLVNDLDFIADANLLHRIGFVIQNAFIRRNSIKGSERNIKEHYDVGNDFYSLWLDRSMTYSSALFGGQDKSLEQAQQSKYERIIEKLSGSKSSILEIGCGWGGFAECATAHDHHVTGLTISPAQHGFATERLRGRDADIRLEDYRKVRGTFDNIVSIEMFEAVGEHYWPAYFNAVAERLTRGGRAVIQTITIRDDMFASYRVRSDFIRHYVFPGGMLPSLTRFVEEAERAGLKVVSTFAFGQDYAQTLRAWSAKMAARKDEISALGHDQKFFRNWQFYLSICAAAFATDRTNVVQVELANA